MKKISSTILTYLMTIVLLIVSTYFSFAQPKAMLGFRLMPTVTAMKIQTSSGGSYQSQAVLGFGIGGVAGYSITEHLGIQGEVMYNSLSQKYVLSNSVNKINLRYLNIPVLLSINTGRSNSVNANIVLGPQVGFSVGSKLSSTGSDSVQAVLAVKKSDFGFAYGAGIDFGLNPNKTFRLAMGFRGVYGLFNIANSNSSNSNNSYYILGKTNIETYAVYLGINFLF
ncbi:MAG TPA: porin family protein [Chitinophagaceae bacterium]|jgi:hypothetical protein|nr:porin family protein [Chitinophagaceae bacterium]